MIDGEVADEQRREFHGMEYSDLGPAIPVSRFNCWSKSTCGLLLQNFLGYANTRTQRFRVIQIDSHAQYQGKVSCMPRPSAWAN